MFDNSYISLESVAARLNLPDRYLKELVKQGKIPFLSIGRRKRFIEADVREALKKEIEQASPPRFRTIIGGVQ